MEPYKTFETERLILRPTTEEDAPFVLELMNTPKWLQFIGDRNVKNLTDAKVYIAKKMRPQLQRQGYSNYTVVRKIDGAKMGSCGLYDREGLNGIDIGFAFLPEYEGKGYAYEASKRVLEAAFNEFGLTSIKAITTKSNKKSQHLLKKLGLTLLETKTLPNDTKELLVYSIAKQT